MRKLSILVFTAMLSSYVIVSTASTPNCETSQWMVSVEKNNSLGCFKCKNHNWQRMKNWAPSVNKKGYAVMKKGMAYYPACDYLAYKGDQSINIIKMACSWDARKKKCKPFTLLILE